MLVSKQGQGGHADRCPKWHLVTVENVTRLYTIIFSSMAELVDKMKSMNFPHYQTGFIFTGFKQPREDSSSYFLL